jgi:hypothetical protein
LLGLGKGSESYLCQKKAKATGIESKSIAHLNSFMSLCIYSPIFPNSKATILSDRSSGKNFKKPKKYSATHPYTNIFKHISKVF